MTANVRGGRLQVLTAVAAAQKSLLADRLVEIGMWGILSPPMIQWLAAAAVADGLDKRPIVDLAGLGAHGRYQANIRRDLMRAYPVCPAVPEAVLIDTPYKGTKDGRLIPSRIQDPVLLPHELFHGIYTYHRDLFNSFLGNGLDDFWSQVPDNDPRLHNHPMLEVPGWRSKAVPPMLQADGIAFTMKSNSLLCVQWCFLMGQGFGWDQKFLITTFPKVCRVKASEFGEGNDTWQAKWEVIAFSFQALFAGRFPEQLPDGTECAKAGERIAGDFFGVVWVANPDWECLSNEWGVNHFGSHHPCWLCRCTDYDPNLNFRDVSPEAPWKATLHPPGTDPPSQHLVYNIPGVCRFTHPSDLQHTFDLGVLLELHGSVMAELAVVNAILPGPTIDSRTASLWRELREVYAAGQIEKRLQNLTREMFWMGPQQFPCLRCKAAESRHLIWPMMQILHAHFDGSERSGHRLACYHHVWKFYEICYKSGFFLGEVRAQAAFKHLEAFLVHYHWLCQDSLRSGNYLYNFTPKVHLLWHIGYSCRFMNPTAVWNYSFEDFCGRIQRCARAQTAGTPMHLVPRKVMEAYRRALSIKLQQRL